MDPLHVDWVGQLLNKRGGGWWWEGGAERRTRCAEGGKKMRGDFTMENVKLVRPSKTVGLARRRLLVLLLVAAANASEANRAALTL